MVFGHRIAILRLYSFTVIQIWENTLQATDIMALVIIALASVLMVCTFALFN
jgi:hypothetical protein